MNRKSVFYALTAVLFWSTVASAFKFSLRELTYAQLLFYSALTSTLVLFLIAVFFARNELLTILQKNYLGKSLLLGLLNPFLYYLVLFKAYSLLPAHEAQPLNYTWPIMISVFSIIFLKEKLTFRAGIGLLLSFFGVIVIATHGNLFSFHFYNLFGVILAVGSSIIWGAYWIINLLDKRNNAIKLFTSFFTGTIFSAVYLFLTDGFTISNNVFLLGAVYVGIFEMGITFFLWIKGLSLAENNTKISTLAYLSPFLSLLFINFLLKEIIAFSAILGLLFIVSGILIQQSERFTKQKKVQSDS